MTLPADTAIRISQLSKVFKIYHRPADLMLEAITGKTRHRPFWALRDISLEVKRGQAVGIMGRNGAGKSTLLKIITGTLDKTSGEVEVNGRISSILEMGTGFNGDFSGRENIHMGGLMLGLSHDEITSKMDWIIEFSELEDFIDQPFKTYSTGMQARLTFSTAMCIDPDILIVDEILSVGDARFQRKSFNKIQEFRSAGCSILLVSHDVNTIATFCDHAVLIENGKLYDQGEPQRVSKIYYKMLFASEQPRQTEGNSIVADAPESGKEIIEVDISKVKPEKGWVWQYDLSDCGIVGDSLEVPRKSKYILFENESQLRPPHCPHTQIREYGRGAYSHWGTQLYFATSDNTDPRQNGRQYALKHIHLLRKNALPQAAPDSKTLIRNAIREKALKKLGLSKPTEYSERETRMGNKKAEILDFGILDEAGNKVGRLESGKKYILFSTTVFYENVEGAVAGFVIRDTKGVDMFGTSTLVQNRPIPAQEAGAIILTRLEVNMWLTNETYFLTVAIADPYAEENVQYDMRYDGLQFDVARKKDIFTTSIVDLNASISFSSIR